jgi:bis(5'-nucleosidyl)-tetraphosphatase
MDDITGHPRKVANFFYQNSFSLNILVFSGHVDPGEDDFTTALRETREEAGYIESDLKIHPDISFTLNYCVKNKPKNVVYWMAELTNRGKDPILSDEHTEFRFLPKAEAIELAGFNDFADMVEHFDIKIRELHQL